MRKQHGSFSIAWNERKRLVIRALAEVVRPYRAIGSYRHRFFTRQYLQLLQDTEYADPRTIKQLQLLRLKKVLREAEGTHWWRPRLTEAGISARNVDRLEDIERLPPVTKQSFTGVPRAHLLARFAPDSKRLVLFRTSGTTGTPFEWGGDRNSFFVEASSYFLRIAHWYGIRTAAPTRGPLIASFTGPTTAQPSAPFDWSPVEENADGAFRIICARIRTLDLRIFYIYPTNLILFAKKLYETGEHLPFELIIAGGQRLDDDSRAFSEKAFGCPVVCTYGCSEFGQIAVECPSQRHRYHVHTERLLLEILDDNGRPLPNGEEGHITITSLENFAMPLLRYQNGDRGRLLIDPCPCGRTLPSLDFTGKSMDFLTFPSGKVAPFRQISRLLLTSFLSDVEFYQVEQPSVREVIVRTKLKTSDVAGFEKRFAEEFYKYLGNELLLRFEYPDAALWRDYSPGRKLRMFIPLKQ